MPRPPRRRALPSPGSLRGTVALAAGLALVIYLAVTSLPYLAVSPSSDPSFGALNACVLGALSERTGFAVSRDGARVAAWAPHRLVECARGDASPGRTWRVQGVSAGAYDDASTLWFTQQSSDADRPRLWAWSVADEAPRPLASLDVQAVVGTARGAVVLEPSGQLTALAADGSAEGASSLPAPDVRGASLSTSADGERVLVVAFGAAYVLSARAELLRAEAPCTVAFAWWLDQHRARLSCAPSGSLFLTIDLDTGRTEVAPRAPRVPSQRLGPGETWVQACDLLPCTAPAP